MTPKIGQLFICLSSKEIWRINKIYRTSVDIECIKGNPYIIEYPFGYLLDKQNYKYLGDGTKVGNILYAQ